MTGVVYAALALKPGSLFTKLNPESTLVVQDTLYPNVRANSDNLDCHVEAVGAETSKAYVPARNISVSAYRIGHSSPESKTNVKHVVQKLISMNSTASPDDKPDSTYLTLAFSHVYKSLTSRELVVLTVQASQPKLVLLSKGVPVFCFAVVSDESTYVVWTNEGQLDKRLQQELSNKVSIYRMPAVTDGVCVVQGYFLTKKFKHWTSVLKDNLKIMSALEAHLSKRWVLD